MLVLFLALISKLNASTIPSLVVLIKTPYWPTVFVSNKKNGMVFRTYLYNSPTPINNFYHVSSHSGIDGAFSTYCNLYPEYYSRDYTSAITNSSHQNPSETQLDGGEYITLFVKKRVYNFIFQINAECLPYTGKAYIITCIISFIVSVGLCNVYLFGLMKGNYSIEFTEITDMIFFFSWIISEMVELRK